MFKVYKEVFNLLGKYKYCVLRNANELPINNTSNDIDILVEKEHFIHLKAELIDTLKKLDYDRAETSVFFGIECFTFYSSRGSFPPLKLDFFFNYSGGGLNYLTFQEVYLHATKNENGVYVLNEPFEAFLTALKTFLSGGKLKPKYYKQLLSVDITPFLSDYKFLGKVIQDIKSCQSNTPDFKGERFKYFRGLLKLNIYKYGIYNTAKGLFEHLKIELQRIRLKKRFIAIAGIDGSGKSTLIDIALENTLSDYKSIKERFILEHHRPRLIPHLSSIKKHKSVDERNSTLENPRSGLISNSLLSYIKFFYYLIDYSICFWIKHVNQLRRDKVIIYDRYFFDFLVDPQRSAIKIPESVVKLAYKLFVPKPEKTIYVTVPPIVAVERKGELELEDAKKLQERYINNKDYWGNSTIIINDELVNSCQLFKLALINALTCEIEKI